MAKSKPPTGKGSAKKAKKAGANFPVTKSKSAAAAKKGGAKRPVPAAMKKKAPAGFVPFGKKAAKKVPAKKKATKKSAKKAY